mmetsp:Transcript_994/g.1536  ORF Transcript_994/g.1536 Transcript_994/m.1536 type:complete len:390 (-) Transcript_994:88-1257(-)|eukprot:CAMPEP_0184649998 /NCGR_PEP_ID=MMETSP0308-20130426/7479_1 /TAXON_ID=38269 /ORGANISM="Gloeochaete witrockiana, Strain SAG 46.84" /LENGTH=389 /DNA_ID=CAMNT_0027083199 /DNA_START=120 /DNA_END=1289 /DNA_ORIENTATION=+
MEPLLTTPNKSAPSLSDILASTQANPLKLGMSGDAIKWIQIALKFPDSDVTGVYDEKTVSALKEYIRKSFPDVLAHDDHDHDVVSAPPPTPSALEPTPSVPAVTEVKLPPPPFSKVGASLEQASKIVLRTVGQSTWQPAPLLVEVENGGKVLKRGMKGPAVARVQVLLKIHPNDQDGIFGGVLEQIVAHFRRHFLGDKTDILIVDRTTLFKLYDLSKELEDLGDAYNADGYENKVRQTISVIDLPKQYWNNPNRSPPVAAQPAVTRSLHLMAKAAKKEIGVRLTVRNGFRTNQEQIELYEDFLAGRGNPANQPGTSNHQMGVSFDINVTSKNDPLYIWLTKRALGFGFLNDVKREIWHWTFFYPPIAGLKAAQLAEAELAAIPIQKSNL